MVPAASSSFPGPLKSHKSDNNTQRKLPSHLENGLSTLNGRRHTNQTQNAVLAVLHYAAFNFSLRIECWFLNFTQRNYQRKVEQVY